MTATTGRRGPGGPAPYGYLADQLRAHASLHPDRTALIVDGRPDLRYAEWDQASEALARGLIERGTTPGTRVGIYFGGMDWTGYATAYLGVLKAGGTVVHLPTHIPVPELVRRAEQCSMAGIVHGAVPPWPVPGVAWSGTAADLSAEGSAPAAFAPDPLDDAEIVYSSGTTGVARGVVVPHQNLATAGGPPSVMAHDEPTPMVASVVLGITASATTISMVLNATPTTLALAAPGDVERFATLIERHRASTVMMTPQLAVGMRRRRVDLRHDLGSVTTIATASSFLHAPVAAALLEMMPRARVLGAYSASQAKPAITICEFDPARPMSVGRPAPGTHVVITDDDGTELPPGRLGRIWLRADGALPRVRLDSDPADDAGPAGFTHTGDLGRLTTDGGLDLFDRETDAVATSDGLVSSLEVETVLLAHPDVVDAAAVAAGDGDRTRVAAVVVLADGADTGSAAVRARLTRHAAGHLAAHEIPAEVVVVDELPRNDLGKVVKRRLRDLVDHDGARVDTRISA